MALTVREALEIAPINRGRLVAGAGGLDLAVKNVTVLEVLEQGELERFLDPQLFTISSLYAIADNVEEQVKMIRRLHSFQASALALHNVGAVIPKLAQEVIDVCNELDFPLIQMPLDVSYNEVFNAIIDQLFDYQVHKFENSILIYEAYLNQLMKAGDNYSSLLDMLAGMIHTRLAFFNHNQKCLYSSWKNPRAAMPERLLPHIRAQYFELSSETESGTVIELDGIPYLLRPVRNNDAYYGVLVVENVRQPLSDMVNLSISQTCRALCIALLNSERQDEYRKRRGYEYLLDLVMGKIENRMMILSQGRVLGYSISEVDRILVISLKRATQPQPGETLEVIQMIESQIEKVFSGIIPIARPDAAELILLTAGKKPENIAYIGKWLSTLELHDEWEISMGVSTHCGNPEMIPSCYKQAQQAVAVFGKLFPEYKIPYVLYDDVRIFALLQESIDREKAREVTASMFGAVEHYDQNSDSHLLQTFFELLASNVSTADVAQNMFLHKNTVLQRKRKIAGFYETDPFEGANHMRYELGFILKRLFVL